jgi:hypothetical protein
LKRVGILGLVHMHRFTQKHPDLFAKFIAEQMQLPLVKQCPFALACIEITDLLCDLWNINSGGHLIGSMENVHPLVLAIEQIHNVILTSFFQIWKEMSASVIDTEKVINLFRFYLKKIFSKVENVSQVFEFENEMQSLSYQKLREIQLKLMNEKHDSLLSKFNVRQLRNSHFQNNVEFMKQQRLSCLRKGHWFIIYDDGRKKNDGRNEEGRYDGRDLKASESYESLNSSFDDSGVSSGQKTHRFCQLIGKHLCYIDYSQIRETTPTRFSEKLDISQITDLSIQNNAKTKVYTLEVTLSGDKKIQFSSMSEMPIIEWIDGLSFVTQGDLYYSELINQLSDIDTELSLLEMRQFPNVDQMLNAVTNIDDLVFPDDLVNFKHLTQYDLELLK